MQFKPAFGAMHPMKLFELLDFPLGHLFLEFIRQGPSFVDFHPGKIIFFFVGRFLSCHEISLPGLSIGFFPALQVNYRNKESLEIDEIAPIYGGVTVLLIVYVTLLGMLLGSFLGLAVIRIPRGESLMTPRSHCRLCEHTLAWFENIPILSYLFLRGKCGNCGERISPKYLVIEIVTALVTVAAFLEIHPWPRFLLYLFLFLIPMLLLMFLDWEALLLPDFITLPGIVAGFLARWLDGQYFLPYQFGISTHKLLLESLLGATAGSLSLFLLAWAYHKFRHREGLGGGDIKLGAMIGAFFGWKEVFFIFFLASVVGSIVGTIILYLKGRDRDTPLPFGSFLAAVSILYLFFGERWVSAYFTWMRG